MGDAGLQARDLCEEEGPVEAREVPRGIGGRLQPERRALRERATCPVSTGGGTRRVQSVREGGRGGVLRERATQLARHLVQHHLVPREQLRALLPAACPISTG